MRIIALVKNRDHVCCRYRIAPFVSDWERQGHEVEVRPWSAAWMFGQLLAGGRKPADLLIIQRRLFTLWQWRLLRRIARRIVYDFDDAVFQHSSYNPEGSSCPRRFRQFREIAQSSDIIVAGNSFLREHACALADPVRVHLIPTCVEVSRYPVSTHHRMREVKLAWIGSSGTLRGLERIGGLLEEIGKSALGVELRIICDRSLKLTNLRVDFRDWSENTETTDLAESDIGISWLPNDRWSDGKCGLKVLQYMAAGLPVIANPVGVQATLVTPGETGFLAETTNEWITAVHRLANDPGLRRRMGEAGRRRVQAEYDTSRGTKLWRKVLRAVCDVNSPRTESSFA